jgi:hypothetical protein
VLVLALEAGRLVAIRQVEHANQSDMSVVLRKCACLLLTLHVRLAKGVATERERQRGASNSSSRTGMDQSRDLQTLECCVTDLEGARYGAPDAVQRVLLVVFRRPPRPIGAANLDVHVRIALDDTAGRLAVA